MRKLSRQRSNRQALERSLLQALITHGHIVTTEAKAKHVQPFAEELLTLARSETMASHRRVSGLIQQPTVLKQLYTTIIPQLPKRVSGFTRVIKTTPRLGDAAPQAMLMIDQLPKTVDSAPVKSARKSKRV